MPTELKDRLCSSLTDTYDTVSDADTEIGETITIVASSRLSRFRKPIVRIVVYILLFTVAVALLSQTWTALQSMRVLSCNCGESVKEAISHGCKYDSLAAAWLPDWCRDDELLAEFEKLGPNADGSWDCMSLSMSIAKILIIITIVPRL